MKILFLFIFILIALFSLLSVGRSATSQNPSADSLKIVEKVYLHSDRDTYYPGDDLWFKAYLIDASDRSLTNHSQNLHVELISPAFIIVDSRIVKLNEGLATGDFHLSENLNYYNADNPAIVKLIVEGITSTGIPVTGKAEYEVKIMLNFRL